MIIGFDQAMEIFKLAAVVLAFYFMYRSFPPQQTAELIKELSAAAKTTKTPVDDLLVDVVKLLNELRLQQPVLPAPPSEPLADDGGELTITKLEL